MLTELRITGLGVIDEAVAEFAPGLSVLTGETGAGKTMVVTGLRLLTGGRADASRVRKGAERAIVEGRFELADVQEDRAELAREFITDIDGDYDDDGSVIVTRRVGVDGRSRANLAGRAVPASTLAQFGGALLAVHGQNDQLRLLRPEAQREALDTHGGSELAQILKKYREVYRRWRAAEKDLAERSSKARELAQEADMLQHALAEIAEVDPQPDEQAQLDAMIRRMTDSESLRLIAAEAHAAITGGDDILDRDPIAAHLDQLAGQLESAGDDELREMAGRIREAVGTLSDVGNELGSFLAELEVDEDALEAALARRHAFKGLTRKYGEDIEAVLAWAAEARRRVAHLDTSDEAMDALKDQVKNLRSEITKVGGELTAQRRKAADSLAKRVSAELAELSMGSMTLQVRITPTTTGPNIGGIFPTESGLDVVELLLSGSAGSVPLNKGASGGELSRVMLALEVVLAGQSGGGTLVFDEVDAGVGGKAALSIGKRLALLAQRHQVLAVTHLAQVAAFADSHIVVRKQAGEKSIISAVEPVTGDDRVKELARMLAGMDESETGLAHAQDLWEKAQAEKAEKAVETKRGTVGRKSRN